jgi:hypothetical protein
MTESFRYLEQRHFCNEIHMGMGKYIRLVIIQFVPEEIKTI